MIQLHYDVSKLLYNRRLNLEGVIHNKDIQMEHMHILYLKIP